MMLRSSVSAILFLSTPSARRATGYGPRASAVQLFLSTPSARRATDGVADVRINQVISIHALREEGDIEAGRAAGHFKISIHALREEGDTPIDPVQGFPRISIHALREEGDL